MVSTGTKTVIGLGSVAALGATAFILFSKAKGEQVGASGGQEGAPEVPPPSSATSSGSGNAAYDSLVNTGAAGQSREGEGEVLVTVGGKVVGRTDPGAAVPTAALTAGQIINQVREAITSSGAAVGLSDAQRGSLQIQAIRQVSAQAAGITDASEKALNQAASRAIITPVEPSTPKVKGTQGSTSAPLMSFAPVANVSTPASKQTSVVSKAASNVQSAVSNVVSKISSALKKK